ncbi:APC family permease [Cyanobium gracile]|uniref:Amino acid transporter n=1 Tax=Cyanobium gracile (strain ATCC 27147 / PCC 6307) TaxID=292564 RepID=K9P8W1_CYAGP|nr:APC family permease [Cyanobium gracile]AFY29560.1 amino acid transporter [Cyanobium gracile PCC 6307]
MAPDQAATAQTPGRLLSVLGVSFGIAGAVGGTIGAGILRTPGLVAAQLGSGPWVVAAWLAGGLYALLGANAVAELGASLPLAGGWYVYARRCFGDAAGFTVGWMDWIGHCTGIAWVAVTIGEYAAFLLPGLEPHGKLVGLAVLLLFTLIQLLGVEAGSGSQKLLSLAKAVAFLAVVAACVLLGGPDTRAAAAAAIPATALATPAGWTGLAVALVFSLQAIITTYDGWHSPIYFSEEFSEPQEDLPRSLIGGVLAVIAIYTLFNLALLRVLPLKVIAVSSLPVADAAALLFGAFGGQAITVLALLSLAGLINASIMGAPRILYGLSRDRLFSPLVDRVNRGGTPTVALVLTSLASALLVLGGDFTILLGLAAFLYVSLYLVGIVCLFVLRFKEPERPRPYRAWGHPWSTAIVLVGSIAFLVGALRNDTANSGWALLLIGGGVPVFQATRALTPAEAP